MKIKDLRRRHPDHLGSDLTRYRALYAGGKAWRAQISAWLPKHDTEPDARWTARKAEATYTNHAGAIVDFFGAHLFSEPVSVDLGEKATGSDAEWLTGWIDDVDQVGTSLTDWLHEHLFTDAMVGRVSYAWVNLPARTREFTDRADQEKAGALNAFLVPIKPEQVVWAEWEGARLRWLLLEDIVESRQDAASPVVRVWRWTAIDDKVVRRWEWTPAPGREDGPRDDEDAAEIDPVAHGCPTGIPVVGLCLKPGLWAMSKLADPAVAHLRSSNHLDWFLSLSANPLLCVESNADTESPVLGTGYFIRHGLGGEVYYAEPSGSFGTILAERITAHREDLYRVVHQLAQAADSSATRTQLSAESKQSDWQAEQIILAAYASAVKDAARRILDVVAAIRQVDLEGATVSGLEGWQQEDVAGELEAMALAIDARTMSPTFRREVARRQARRVLVDAKAETLDAIDKEINEAPAEDPALYAPPPSGASNGKPPGSPGAAGGGSRRPPGR